MAVSGIAHPRLYMIVFIEKLIVPKSFFDFQVQDWCGVDRDALIVCPAHNGYFMPGCPCQLSMRQGQRAIPGCHGVEGVGLVGLNVQKPELLSSEYDFRPNNIRVASSTPDGIGIMTEAPRSSSPASLRASFSSEAIWRGGESCAYRSTLRSRHVGFIFLISSILRRREPAFNCFSRAIATSAVSAISK